MLTVDLDRLGVGPGDVVLDLGCGGGRHAYEIARRGAKVVAMDAEISALDGVGAMLGAMSEGGELPPGGVGMPLAADALALPFGDGVFDHVVASEVLEHIPDHRQAVSELARVTKPAGRVAVTVPRWWPEVVNWALSDAYHNRPGGHVRIYRRSVLNALFATVGMAEAHRSHAHGLHSPYWWLRCLVGVDNDKHPLVVAYHRFLVWDIMARPAITRLAERALAPLIGKSLVVYYAPSGS